MLILIGIICFLGILLFFCALVTVTPTQKETEDAEQLQWLKKYNEKGV